MSELMQIPSVILTEKAFKNAQEAGIVGIDANRDHMLALGQLTETGAEFIPDITIMRAYGSQRGQWDVNYKDAGPNYQYVPSRDLGLAERDHQTISAGGLRVHGHQAGKKILELTVHDWGALSATFVEAMYDSQGHGIAGITDRILTPLAKLTSNLLSQPEIQTPRMRHMEQAKDLHPYIISR